MNMGIYGEVEEMLRSHGKWDIRPPSGDRKWTVFPEYAPGIMGCGENLLEALRDATRQLKVRKGKDS
jgi:hypothetical protein